MTSPLWAVVAAGLSGLAHAIAFPPVGQAVAAFLFAVPLLLWMARAQPAGGRAFLFGFLGFWGSWAWLLSWIRHCTQVLEGPWAPLLGWGLVAALAGILALFPAAWCGLLAQWMRGWRGRPWWVRAVLMGGAAGAWVLLEWVRSWVATGFPWLPLAASMWESPGMLQWLSHTGAWGLSFALIFLNLSVAAYVLHLLDGRSGPEWWRRFSIEFYLGLGLLLLTTVAPILQRTALTRGREDLFRAGVVQPYISQVQKWDRAYADAAITVFERFSTIAVEGLGAEALVWPEASTPWPLLGDAGMQEWVEGLARTLQRPILLGALAIGAAEAEGEEAPWFNSVFTVDPESGVDRERGYAKRKLVPFGEYVPLARWIPMVRKLVPLHGSIEPGHEATVLLLRAGGRVWRVGPLICSEDIFPHLTRATVRQGVDFLFVATNNAWFGEYGGAVQHAAHSVLRAVESRRPVLRVGNGGWSGWIDEYGNIRDVLMDPELGVYHRGVADFRLARDPYWAGYLTFQVRYGDWFVALCAVLLAAALVAVRTCGAGHSGRPESARHP